MVRDLHVTSPMMNGRDVFELQQRLAALGYRPGVADGAYGPTTEGAVRAFQRNHALEVDGVVGPQTRSALATATPQAGPKPSEFGLKALDEARKHLGTKESPPGSGSTMFGAWFGANGVALSPPAT